MSCVGERRLDRLCAGRGSRRPTAGRTPRNRSLTRSDPSGIDHERSMPSVPERRDLRAAAAHVEREPARHGQVVDRPVEAQHRLVVAVDRLQRHAQPIGPFDQLVSVRRLAHRRRRHGDHLRRAGPLRDRDEVAQRLERPLDRLRPEPVGIAEVPRQSQRCARVLDHVEVLALAEPEDDHPARVRADVDDREGPVVGRGVEDRVHAPMLPHACRARDVRLAIDTPERVPRLCHVSAGRLSHDRDAAGVPPASARRSRRPSSAPPNRLRHRARSHSRRDTAMRRLRPQTDLSHLLGGRGLPLPPDVGVVQRLPHRGLWSSDRFSCC